MGKNTRSLYNRWNDTWPRKRKMFPSYPSKDLTISLKKLLKYYPKNPSSLIPITSEIIPKIQSQLTSLAETDELNKLYKKILFRYKPYLFFSQHIDLTCNHLPIWRICRALRHLQLYECIDEEIEDDATYINRKAIKSNKFLSSLMLDSTIESAFEILPHLRSLKSLDISYALLRSAEKLRKILTNSLFSLETVTVSRWLAGHESIEPLRVICELPKLKRLNYDCSGRCDINRLPFKALQNRKISYDFRGMQPIDLLEFSISSELALEDLDLLAINFKTKWGTRDTKWDQFNADFVDKQEIVQRSLFLNLSAKTEADLSSLFQICKNIRVLHITLSQEDEKVRNGTGYHSLRNLSKLEHLFIVLDAITIFKQAFVKELPDQTHELFENLTYCAGSIKSVSIHIYGESDPQSCKQAIIGFFAACANTLTDLTFKFTFDTYAVPKNTNLFYGAIAKLKHLSCLKLIYERFSNENFQNHSKSIKNLVLFDIKELCISSDTVDSGSITINVPPIKDLQKLSMIYDTLNSSSEFFKIRTHTQNSLKYLEISLNKLNQENWHKLLNTLDFLKGLEVLKIKIGDLPLIQN